MICLRFDLRRKMILYVQGLLPAARRRVVEDHLVNCAKCRDRLAQVTEGDRLAKILPPVASPDVPWKNIEVAIQSHYSPQPSRPRWVPAIAAVCSVVIMIGTAMFTLTMSPGSSNDFDRGEFLNVPLSDMHNNVEPHVATEGYVTEVRLNDEDGDTLFKLVDNLQSPNHFVICEIIEPVKLDIPSVGSRIRVYGVHRYDGKAQHQWNEVHPVLNIEPVH